MRKVTEILINDHRQLLQQLNKLENDLDNSDISAKAREEIISIADFFKTKVKTHFLNEESCLFPLLEKVPGMREGPLKLIKYEHNEYRNIDLKFQELVERLLFKENLAEFQDELKKTGKALILMIREHINKEDNVLFPMAEKFIDETDLLTAAEKMRIFTHS